MTAAVDITGLRFFNFAVVQPVCGNDQRYGRNQRIKKLLVEELLCHQTQDT